MSEPQHLMISSLSSDGLFPVMMTSEAKKNIELWSDNVQQTTNADLMAPARAAAAAAEPEAVGVEAAAEEEIHPLHHHLHHLLLPLVHVHPQSPHLLHSLHRQHGSVPSSSSPDLSAREEEGENEAGILDEDLRSLREQQRRGMEWTRLQHALQ